MSTGATEPACSSPVRPFFPRTGIRPAAQGDQDVKSGISAQQENYVISILRLRKLRVGIIAPGTMASTGKGRTLWAPRWSSPDRSFLLQVPWPPFSLAKPCYNP